MYAILIERSIIYNIKEIDLLEKITKNTNYILLSHVAHLNSSVAHLNISKECVRKMQECHNCKSIIKT